MAESKTSKRQQGRYCVAGAPNQQSCQNRSFTLGIRMYKCPKDPVVRSKWVQFVCRHRHDFNDPTSEYTLLCLAHFKESCYQKNLAILSRMEDQGLKMNWCLKKDAVPTRDTIVPPAPEELSNHRKRQDFHMFLVIRYAADTFHNPEFLVINVSLSCLPSFFPYHYLYTSFYSLLFMLCICLMIVAYSPS